MFSGRQRRLAYLALAAMPFLFSTNVIIGRAAATSVDPWTLAFLRWLIATALLALIARRDLVRHAADLKRIWPILALCGFIGMWICGGLVYLALHWTSATNGALIYSTTAVFILLLEWLFRGRSIGLRDILGVTACLTGVLVIVGHGSLDRMLGLSFNGGDLLFALATLGWATYTMIMRRSEITALPGLAVFTVIAGFGALSLTPFALYEMVVAGGPPTSPIAWFSVIGAALVPSIMAYSAFQYGIRVLGSTVAGIFSYLLLPAGVLLAALFLGERLEPFHAAGSVLIMGGIVIATAPLGALLNRFRRGPETSR